MDTKQTLESCKEADVTDMKDIIRFRKSVEPLIKQALPTFYKGNIVKKFKNWLDSESDELYEAFIKDDYDHIVDESGDILMAAIAYIEALGVDPSEALSRGFKKYVNRISCVESGDSWVEAKIKFPGHKATT